MRVTHQQIESMKDWIRAAWVVALTVCVLLWAVGEDRWYDPYMRIVTVAMFAGLTLAGVAIGWLFPQRD